MSTSPASARPGTAAAAARRPRRAIIALAVAGALTGGGLIAAAPHASATVGSTTVGTVAAKASTWKPKPEVGLLATGSSVTRSSGKKSPAFTVKARYRGKAISGTARLYVNNKAVDSARLRHGNARFHPGPSRYENGTNKVRVLVRPSWARLDARWTRTATVKASISSPVVALAKSKVGSRYVSGATGPSAFDCSGFTSYVYKKAIGKTLPRSSSAQKHVGKKVSRTNAKPGDLIWSPGHVAIYIGNGKQIDAGNPRVGVVKRSIWQSNPTFIRVSSKAI